LKELGSGGFSAYGIAENEGGVAVIEVPEGSAAARAGLKTGDLLLQINGQRVSRVGQVRRFAAATGAGPLTLKIVRDQTPMTLTLPVAGDDAQSPDASRPARKQAYAATVEKITIAEKPVTIKVPDQPAPGKPWLWVGEFGGHLKSLEDGLVKKGWHVVYVGVSGQFGSPRAMEVWEKVYEEMHGKRGLSAKPALLGISRGGLYVTAWTRLHPDRVSVLFLDNGVCDIRSWPAGFQLTKQGKGSPKDWKLCKAEFAYTSDAEAVEKAAKPCDGMLPAIQAGVRLISCHGTADSVVPYEDNAAHLMKFWQDNGGRLKLFPKEGADHHPHGLPDPAPLIAAIAAEAASP
jgi:pimeloyl-ACP methyl ester carboxylesterase